MDTKLTILVSVLTFILLLGCVCSAPLDEQLPDTTGLFFGKRSHPNMNSLLFGRRSYSSVADQLPDTTGLFFGKRGAGHPNMNGLLFGKRSMREERKFDITEAKQVCKAVKVT